MPEYDDEEEGPEAEPKVPNGNLKMQVTLDMEGWGGRGTVLDRRLEGRIGSGAMAAVEKAAEQIMETLLDASFRVHDQFGQPQGEPTTMRALMAARASHVLEELVDSGGKPTRKGEYGYQSATAWLQWFVNQHTAHEFDRALSFSLSFKVAVGLS